MTNHVHTFSEAHSSIHNSWVQGLLEIQIFCFLEMWWLNRCKATFNFCLIYWEYPHISLKFNKWLLPQIPLEVLHSVWYMHQIIFLESWTCWLLKPLWQDSWVQHRTLFLPFLALITFIILFLFLWLMSFYPSPHISHLSWGEDRVNFSHHGFWCIIMDLSQLLLHNTIPSPNAIT